MIKQEFSLQSGETFPVLVPQSYAEFDGLPGGRVNLALECAIDDVVYRGASASVRDALAEAVAALYSNLPRETKPHPNAEKAKKGETVFAESPGKFLGRVAASVEGLLEEAPFQNVVDKLVAASDAVLA